MQLDNKAIILVLLLFSIIVLLFIPGIPSLPYNECMWYTENTDLNCQLAQAGDYNGLLTAWVGNKITAINIFDANVIDVNGQFLQIHQPLPPNEGQHVLHNAPVFEGGSVTVGNVTDLNMYLTNIGVGTWTPNSPPYTSAVQVFAYKDFPNGDRIYSSSGAGASLLGCEFNYCDFGLDWNLVPEASGYVVIFYSEDPNIPNGPTNYDHHQDNYSSNTMTWYYNANQAGAVTSPTSIDLSLIGTKGIIANKLYTNQLEIADGTTTNRGGLAGGVVTQSGYTGLIKSEASSIAYGKVTANSINSDITASGDGSVSVGYVNNGSIYNQAQGTFAGGYVDGGRIISSTPGNFVWGKTSGTNSELGSSGGGGSFVLGNVQNSGGGVGYVYSNGQSAFNVSYLVQNSTNNSQNNSSGYASVLIGYNENGTMTSGGKASFVGGKVGQNGQLVGNADASFMWASAYGNQGNGTYSTITNSSENALTFGKAQANNNNISINNNGGMAYFNVTDGGFNVGDTAFGFGKVYGSSGQNPYLNATGIASLTFGNVYAQNRSSYISTSSGQGALGFGYASDGGISSTSNGSFGGGYANGSTNYDAQIYSQSNGSFAHGSVIAQSNNATISANGTGAMATGSAYNGYISSSGTGSIAHGNSYFGQITSNSNGSLAGGYANGDSSHFPNIGATNNGAIAWGQSDYYNNSSGSISASSPGAVALGYAQGGNIQAQASGSFAGGKTEYNNSHNSEIISNQTGAFSWGRAASYNQDSSIRSSDNGAVAFGYAEDGQIYSGYPGSLAIGHAQGNSNYSAYIQSQGSGAFAHGHVNPSNDRAGYIQTQNLGATASGYVYGGTIRGSGYGSFANGAVQSNDATNIAEIIASQNGAFANGYAYANSGGVGLAAIYANGQGSVALGYAQDHVSQATGLASFVMGQNVQANADHVYVFGKDVNTSNYRSFLVGWDRNIFWIDEYGAHVDGKLSVSGSIDPTDLHLTPQSTVPPAAVGKMYTDDGSNGVAGHLYYSIDGSSYFDLVSGSQTPWLSDINGNDFNLFNVNDVNVNGDLWFKPIDGIEHSVGLLNIDGNITGMNLFMNDSDPNHETLRLFVNNNKVFEAGGGQVCIYDLHNNCIFNATDGIVSDTFGDSIATVNTNGWQLGSQPSHDYGIFKDGVGGRSEYTFNTDGDTGANDFLRMSVGGITKLLSFDNNTEIFGNWISDSNISVADARFDSSWNGDFNVPTKNAVYDKISTLAGDVNSNNMTNKTGSESVITTFTPSDLNHTYLVGGYANIAAISAGTLTQTVTFIDELGNFRTITSTGITTIGFTSFTPATIRVTPGGTITVNQTFVGVSINYDAGAFTQKIS